MHTHNIYAHPCSLNCIWLNSRKALLCDSRLCWRKRCRASPVPSHGKEQVCWCYSCPAIQLLTPLSPTTSRVPRAFMLELFPAFPLPLAPWGTWYISPRLSALGRFQLTGNSPIFLDGSQIRILGMHALISNSFLFQPSLPSSQEIPN